jgi:hypothetical protein
VPVLISMKAKDVDFFEKVKAQLQQLNTEVGALSKSKPDNPINKFKLGFINEKLNEANTILTGEFKPFKDFTVFNADELPSNSDVVMVLSQYLDCLEAWRCAHVYHVPGRGHLWKADDVQDIRTEPPSRYRKA